MAVLPHTTAEWVILDLLMDASEQTLAVAELVEAIGSPVAVAEAIDSLHAAGLVTRAGQLVTVASDPSSRPDG